MKSAAHLKRPILALAVASVLGAGFSEFVLPGIRDANAVSAQQPAAQSAAPLPDFARLVEEQGPAVVGISVKKTSQRTAMPGAPQQQIPPQLEEFFRHFGIPRPEGRMIPNPSPAQGVGSGFIVSADGYILTNAHVVDGAGEVTVKLSDKRSLTAKVVGLDPMSDVAVVKVDATGLPVAKVGDPKKTRVGEWVVAIGSPFGMEHSVTSGIVSGKSRNLPSERLVPFIQTDVAVNPGNSGGPLFNMAGEVIGINSQIYSTTGGYMGMSFAIPIDVAMKVKDELVAHGKVTRGRMGVAVQELNPALARSFGLEQPRGALVSNVESGSPAAKAGLQAGDVIVGFNGKPIENSGELPALVADTDPGTTAKVRIVRNGAEQELELTVAEMPAQRAQVAGAPSTQQGKLGVSVRQSDKGVLVESAEGPAAKAGIRAGDIIVGVNGKPVKSAEELKASVDGAGNTFALLVQRGESRIYVPVQIG